MKNVKDIGAQGDVLFRRVDEMPRGVQPVSLEGGRLVATHSETGHHHAIDVDAAAPHAAMFRVPGDPLVAYLKISRDADVVHHRPWDTHETLRLLADGEGETIFEIRRQREWTPEGWRRVED